MRWFYGAGSVVLVALAGTFLFLPPRDTAIEPKAGANEAVGTIETSSVETPEAVPVEVPTATAPATTTGTTTITIVPHPASNDIGPQPQLTNPPAIVKGIYLTGWSSGSASKVKSVIDLIDRTELNSVVVDIKDYSGYVSYVTNVPEARSSGAENEIRIARPNALIKQFHDHGIYVIGRITNFQDPIIANAHPEWALKDKRTGGIWRDNKGLAWLDPAAKPAWNYLAALAKDGFDRGFDEIQFDYIRFASDGSIGNIGYPYWDEKSSRSSVIANYEKFLRETFPGKKISADLFGLATVNNDDLGIGQVIQDAYASFDYVSPMVYPSHYATGFLGYKSPAGYPYEVVKYSMDRALAKLVAMGDTSGTGSSTVSAVPPSKLRPWLQDFTINGVAYGATKVRDQIRAVYDALDTATGSQYYGGWILWNASNNYTAAALMAQ